MVPYSVVHLSSANISMRYYVPYDITYLYVYYSISIIVYKCRLGLVLGLELYHNRDFKLIVFEAMCHSAKCTSASIYDVLILYYYIRILRM